VSYLREIDRWFIAEVLPHEPAYLGRARRLCVDRSEAADLVQEAYVRLLRLEAWRGLTSPRAYTLQTIRNLAVERLRRARIVEFRQIAGLEALAFSDDAPDALTTVIARDQLDRLLAAVEALPPACREIVVLRRFEELAPREIAQRLGLSLSTLEKRLARGLTLLARAMADPLLPDQGQAPQAQGKTPSKTLRRRLF
jgi:RNA polymerase sigma factor (sigma-70 family)